MPIRDLESWMWLEACEVLDRADRLHRQFFRPAVTKIKPPAWEPPVDIYETDYHFTITVALPGVVPEHLTVSAEGNSLLVEGKRHLPTGAEANIRRIEIPYGRFQRRIDLPIGRFEIDRRDFVNGCLILTLRKL